MPERWGGEDKRRPLRSYQPVVMFFSSAAKIDTPDELGFMKSNEMVPSSDNLMLVMAFPMKFLPSVLGVNKTEAGLELSVRLSLTANVAVSV